MSDPVNAAHNDGQNQVYSVLGVIGTLGTADTKGTAPTLPIGVNPTTGAMYVDVLDTTFNVGTLSVGTINQVGTVSEITNGSIVVTAGTVIVTTGTVNSGTINAGTINSGTINAGTIKNDGRPARNILSFATTIAFAGSAFATIVGSAAVGAGTSIWVNDVSIVNNGGTQKYALVFGSAIDGSAVLAKGQFGPQGGIQKSFPMPVNCGMTNFDLNAWAEGAGTADFSVSYFISA